MNEQEIKEKLLEESKGYEIKTKSEDIIEAFKMKKYKKVPFYFSKVFITSVSSLALFTLIAVPTFWVCHNYKNYHFLQKHSYLPTLGDS